MGMSWAPAGLGFNLAQNPKFYTNPQGGTVPFSIAPNTPFKTAQQSIQQMLKGGNASALDAYFANWKPTGSFDPKWMKSNWLRAYMAFPGMGAAPGGGPTPGFNDTLSGVPWKVPPAMFQWGQDGPGPILPSTGQPMY